jgi:MFS family permease
MATLARRPSPATWLIGLLAAAILLNYIDRGAVGIAAPLMKSELALSATGFGLAVSAFFWVYAPIQLLIGWWRSKRRPKARLRLGRLGGRPSLAVSCPSVLVAWGRRLASVLSSAEHIEATVAEGRDQQC